MSTPYWPDRLYRVGLKRNSPLVRFIILGALDTVVLIVGMVAVLPWGSGLASPHIALITGVVLSQLVAGSALSLYHNRFPIGSSSELRWQGVVAGVVLMVAVVLSQFIVPVIAIPWVILGLLSADALMIAGRQLLRLWIDIDRRPRQADRVVVVGAGELGQSLIRQMLSDPTSGYLPVALVDDDPAAGKLIVDGVAVRGTSADLATVVDEADAGGVIVAISEAPATLFNRLVGQLDLSRHWIRTVPSLAHLLGENVGLSSIRDFDVSDLIGRTIDSPDTDMIRSLVEGKTVLVTGAGGSIGSELCRLISRHAPERLLLLDRDESALHSLCMSLEGRALMDTPDLVLADIRDGRQIEQIFAEHRPQIVFHTAALKHLPMLESYPLEGWKTNVVGTLNVLSAAHANNVERFVNISTDKAADPISNLGKSKLVGERLTASFARTTGREYVSVRFGNVLGSRGSVLIAFEQQIRAGGPLTVTHPDVTRYFMTIPEACLLVLQAAGVGRPGETLVLDMGTPVRIVDIAQRMMALAGRACPIAYTGLRPGEKLHEDLFSSVEQPEERALEHIWQVRVPELDPQLVRRVPEVVTAVEAFQIDNTARQPRVVPPVEHSGAFTAVGTSERVGRVA